MATVHPPRAPPQPISQPQLALPRSHAGVAVPTADDNDCSDSESVAESCPYHRSTATDLAGDKDDDGCSSCVEGDECYQQLHEDDDEGEINKGSVWWKRLAAAGGVFPPAARAQQRQEEEDPKRVAARQEEDRKFWEDCLASGYP